MTPSPSDPTPREPHWLRWQPLSPLVAAGALWFLGHMSQIELSWPGWSALILAAWAGALVAHASEDRASPASRPLVLAGALASIAAAIAVGWLPRGLVASGIPVAGVAVFQALLSLGERSVWAGRFAIVAGTLGALWVLATAPFGWPPGLRLACMAVAVVLSSSVWNARHTMAAIQGPLVLARGLVFAVGVLLPLFWWAPNGLLGEIARKENMAFTVLAVVAAACRSEWRKPTPSPPALRACAVLLLLLAVVSAFAAWAAPTDPVRGVFLGVSGVAVLLVLGMWADLRAPLPPVWRRSLPDLAWLGLGFAALWMAAKP